LRFPLIQKGHRTEAPQHFQRKRNSVTPPIFFIKPSLVYPLTQLSIGQTYTPLKKRQNANSFRGSRCRVQYRKHTESAQNIGKPKKGSTVRRPVRRRSCAGAPTSGLVYTACINGIRIRTFYLTLHCSAINWLGKQEMSELALSSIQRKKLTLQNRGTPFITMALTGVTTQRKNDFPLGLVLLIMQGLFGD
jgi:hypothetical protein